MATLSGIRVLKFVVKDLLVEIRFNKFWLISAIFLEAVARMLAGMYVCLNNNPKDYKWKIAKTTKNLM